MIIFKSSSRQWKSVAAELHFLQFQAFVLEYIIETECANGVTQKQLDKVCKHAQVRFLGCYDSVEK